MVIDIRTVFVLLCIATLMQAVVFYHQYRINKFVKGPGWWLLWNVAVLISFICMLIRVIPSYTSFAITVQDPFLLLGMIFIYVGINSFLGKKINAKLLIPLYLSFLVGHLFFFYIIDNIAIRTLLIDVYLSLFSFLTIYSLYKYRTKEIASTAAFNMAVLSLNGGVFLYSSVLLLLGIPHDEFFSPIMLNLIQVFDAFFVNLLWTFGFIVMVNQRLTADVSEAKAQLEQIFNTSPDAITITRASDGTCIDFNTSFTRIMGYSKEDLLDKLLPETSLWADQADRNTMINMIRENGFFENFETRFVRKNGESFIGLISAQALTINGVPHLVSVARDISERKQAEEALRASEEQHRLLFETAQEGIIVRVGGELVYFNPMMLEISGYSAEELLGRNLIDFVYPPDRDTVLSNLAKRETGMKAELQYQIRIIRKDGSLRWVEMNGANLEWHGKPATLNFIKDITEQKLAEIALTTAKENLEKLNSEKDKFFSIISHDLKSPFLGFLGLTEIIAEDAENFSPQQLKKFGHDMHQTANNLFKLLKNLLEWSQMQQGSLSFQPKKLSLNKLVAENIATMKERSEQKGISITFETTPVIEVNADERMLNSILLNLLSNAVKFTYRHGKISITIKETADNRAEISVRDTGMGMQKSELERLFKIDEKVGAIGTEGELSTGLGLLLCKEFVEKHGGTIRAESEEGKGSMFCFTLPLIK